MMQKLLNGEIRLVTCNRRAAQLNMVRYYQPRFANIDG